MKNYKDYPRYHLGCSDIARLILSSHDKLEYLNFGGDGSYKAYLVDEEAEIGAHYGLVFEATSWLTVFDDDERTLKIYAKEIKVYQAGECGCIIQTIGCERVKGLVL